MSNWDYWRGTFEAAQAQAQVAASQASKFAEVVSAQVSEQSRVIAAQAAQRANDLSKAAAESTSGARAQLAGMHLPEALANLKLPATDGEQQQPAAEQLEAYAITPDFCTFVRGLTYPTFRDFPQEELDVLVASQQQINGQADGANGSSEGSAPLNPWQARHAMLVCLAVKEMNELRFVLVPKFLSDEQFWAIYFALTRNRLPPEAFDVSLQHSKAPPPTEQPKEQPRRKLPGADIIKPAAQAAAQGESGEGEPKDRAWLRNLVCGFDMEIPAERLQQDTVVLGALQNQFHRLQESARGISIPDNLKHNISANLGNVRDFVGDFVPAARGADASDHVPDAAGSAPGASAAAAGAALPANEALRSDHGASSSAPPGSAAASQQAGSAAVELQASHEDAPMRHADASEPAELIADPDLEAYLKEMESSDHGDAGSQNDDDANSAASLGDGDFDKYLAELSNNSGGGVAGSGADSDAGSGEELELDMDEYMQVIASRDDEDAGDSEAGYSDAEDGTGGNGTAA